MGYWLLMSLFMNPGYGTLNVRQISIMTKRRDSRIWVGQKTGYGYSLAVRKIRNFVEKNALSV